MSEIPQEWVEKAAAAVYSQYGMAEFDERPEASILGRAVLAAVLPDVRRAVAEDVLRRAAWALEGACVVHGDDQECESCRASHDLRELAREIGGTP